MQPIIISIIRVSAVVVVSSLLPAVLILSTSLSIQFHTYLIAALLGIFAISDTYFRSLIVETNTLFRRGGYSTWQLERLQQQATLVRDQAWRCWNASTGLKFAVLFGVAFIHSSSVPTEWVNAVLFACYSSMLFGFVLTLWARRNYRRLEKWCDAISILETSIKEKKRMKGDISSGAAHQFENDEVMKGYNKRTFLAPDRD